MSIYKMKVYEFAKKQKISAGDLIKLMGEYEEFQGITSNFHRLTQPQIDKLVGILQERTEKVETKEEAPKPGELKTDYLPKTSNAYAMGQDPNTFLWEVYTVEINLETKEAKLKDTKVIGTNISKAAHEMRNLMAEEEIAQRRKRRNDNRTRNNIQ